LRYSNLDTPLTHSWGLHSGIHLRIPQQSCFAWLTERHKMNFNLSEEQQMLVDSIGKFLKNDYSFETRRKLANSTLGFSTQNWKTFAELGWLSVPFSADNGGFGG